MQSPARQIAHRLISAWVRLCHANCAWCSRRAVCAHVFQCVLPSTVHHEQPASQSSVSSPPGHRRPQGWLRGDPIRTNMITVRKYQRFTMNSRTAPRHTYLCMSSEQGRRDTGSPGVRTRNVYVRACVRACELHAGSRSREASQLCNGRSKAAWGLPRSRGVWRHGDHVHVRGSFPFFFVR